MNNTATVLADPGAERAVLGAILIDPTRLTELAARLQPCLLYTSIFSAMNR